MTKPNPTKAAFYEILQVTIMGLSLPFQFASWALTQLHPGFIAHRIVRGPYYWACVQKRRARGEEEWQEHDLRIGVRPPEGHPYWKTASKMGGVIMTGGDDEQTS